MFQFCYAQLSKWPYSVTISLLNIFPSSVSKTNNISVVNYSYQNLASIFLRVANSMLIKKVFLHALLYPYEWQYPLIVIPVPGVQK